MAFTSKASARVGWRLVKERYAASAFDGEGAFRFGGRWNSRGVRVVYAAESLALAALEWLVHVDPSAQLPTMMAFPISIPEACLQRVELAISEDEAFPPLSVTRRTGDQWVAGSACPVMTMPSVIVPLERNYLLNLRHPDFEKVRIGQPHCFRWDRRLASAR